MYLPTSLGSFSGFPKTFLLKFKLKSEPTSSFDLRSTKPFFNSKILFSSSDNFIFSALKISLFKLKLKLDNTNVLFKLSVIVV